MLADPIEVDGLGTCFQSKNRKHQLRQIGNAPKPDGKDDALCEVICVRCCSKFSIPCAQLHEPNT